MTMSFHPVEPDLIGPILVAGRAMRRRQRYLRGQLTDFPMGPLMKTILDSALEYA